MRSIFFLLVVVAGSIVGQVFLSKSTSRIPGLILPFISVVLALFSSLNMVIFPDTSGLSATGQVLGVFLLCNIPTAVLLAIYFAVRAKAKKNSEVSRMKLKDLE